MSYFRKVIKVGFSILGPWGPLNLKLLTHSHGPSSWCLSRYSIGETEASFDNCWGRGREIGHKEILFL